MKNFTDSSGFTGMCEKAFVLRASVRLLELEMVKRILPVILSSYLKDGFLTTDEHSSCRYSGLILAVQI